jgi:LAS superfamily LD-carboxypeptidase LdcB
MNEDFLNFIALTIFLIFITVPIYILSFANLVQQQKNQIIYQKYFTEQLAQKEKEVEIQKEAQIKKYLLGQFNPAQMTYFTVVPENYSVSGYTMYLRTETLNAFLNMAQAAEKDGVELKIASATRNFDYQKNLWNNKWNALPSTMDGLIKFKTVLEYSAAPGTSRHHWGTEIDINNANPQYFNTEEGKEVYDWLSKNASLYGFCQPYIAKGTDRPTGYNEEKWHWSYIPLSKNFTEEYAQIISPSDINGFNGDQYVPDLNLINDYVLGINPECLQ